MSISDKPERQKEKDKRRRTLIILLVLLLVLGAAVGTAVVSAKYRSQGRLSGNIIFNVNSDYRFDIDGENRVKNNGATSVWVRAFVICNRVDAEGNILFSDETYTISTGSGWTEGSDGAYYYAEALDKTAVSTEIVTGVTASGTGTDRISVSIIVEVLDTSLGDSAEAAFAAANQ